jgi:uncharacterized protein (UPF0332 family)
MDAHQFLTLAESLAARAEADPDQPDFEALCRTVIGRAYYGTFLLVRELLDSLGLETRRVPNPHATFEQALRNSGVFTLRLIATDLSELCSYRTKADYEPWNAEVETIEKVRDVLNRARTAILQLDIIRAGRLSPPLDRAAVADAILTWARESSKPLWRKA